MTFTDEELKLLADIPPWTKHELLDFACSLKKLKADNKSKDDEGLSPKPVRHGGWVNMSVSDDACEGFVLLTESEYRELKEAAGLINE